MSNRRLLLCASGLVLALTSCGGGSVSPVSSSEGSADSSLPSAFSGEVTFYRNLLPGDKAVLKTVRAQEGKLAEVVADPLHNSYVFLYWAYDAEGSSPADLNEVSSGEIYAIWRLYESFTPAEKTGAFIDKMLSLSPECVAETRGEVQQEFLYYILGQAFETESYFVATRYFEDVVETKNFYPYDVSKTVQENEEAGNLFLTEQDQFDEEEGKAYRLAKYNPDYAGQIMGEANDHRQEFVMDEENKESFLSIGFDAYLLGGINTLTSLLSSGRKMTESNGLDSTSAQGDVFNISGLDVPNIDPSKPGQTFQFYFTMSGKGEDDLTLTEYYGTRIDVAYRDGKIAHAQAWTQYDTYIEYELSVRVATVVSLDFKGAADYPSYPDDLWDPLDFPILSEE